MKTLRLVILVRGSLPRRSSSVVPAFNCHYGRGARRGFRLMIEKGRAVFSATVGGFAGRKARGVLCSSGRRKSASRGRVGPPFFRLTARGAVCDKNLLYCTPVLAPGSCLLVRFHKVCPA